MQERIQIQNKTFILETKRAEEDPSKFVPIIKETVSKRNFRKLSGIIIGMFQTEEEALKNGKIWIEEKLKND